MLLHVCVQNEQLRGVLGQLELEEGVEAGRETEAMVGTSVEYFLAWVRDMQVVHPVARWCWLVLQVVYGDALGAEGELHEQA